MTLGKYGETARFTHPPEQTSRRALTAQGDSEQWDMGDWRTEAGIGQSDTPQHRPQRVLLGKRLSLHGRSGRRPAASRNQRNWFAAIAGAMTWLRVSSSAEIADAASVLVNAMDQRHGSGRLNSRSNLATTWEGTGRPKGLGPFSSRLHLGTMLT